MTSLPEAVEDIVEALRPIRDEIPDLQIHGFWNDVPTPPCLDVYPGSPFQDSAAFGRGAGNRVYFTVRARVGMGDPPSAQALLLRLLDTTDPASVEAALYDENWAVAPEGVSGFTTYADDSNAAEQMLGCEWRVSRFQ